eukprot:TRINITY_DN7609_c0_g1_i2.p1 TRINITY_DN7609_c0_g1~~TRINITY_DN7609_c0_g1_i2.p1  ORF type:complete len:438 (-),score=113.86 TRINITY_DN7609_c0_g1_i2:4-1317(-)
MRSSGHLENDSSNTEKKKQKKLKKYRLDLSKETFPNIFKEQEQKRMQIFEHLPLIKVKKIKKNPRVLDFSSGPLDMQYPNDAVEPWISGRSISTYPFLPGKPQRDGDPICDSFKIELLEENCIVAVVCDGCNWGRRPMEASNRAKDAFTEYMKSHVSEISDIRDGGHYLLQALSYCQFKITENKEDVWEAGTTTLMGGVLLRLKDDEKWVWISVSIGDCKCFHYQASSDTVTDITNGNRQNVYDARDPGGRLGPYVGINGEPDVRNVFVYYNICSENDIILLFSDGVHDNLDPQILGIPPKSVNEKYAIHSDWKDFKTDDDAERVKAEFMQNFLIKDLLCGGEEDKKMRMKILSFATDPDVMSPASVTSRIMKHCFSVTASGREWMEQNPKNKLPFDYVNYPGKMDHATCVVLRVGKFEPTLVKALASSKNRRTSRA